MVKILLTFFFLFFSCFLSSETTVRAFIDDTLSGVQGPLRGKIIVSHDKALKVDTNTFALGGRALEVHLMGTNQQTMISIINGKHDSRTTLVETYEFFIPSAGDGKYILDTITVQVGGITENTSPSSYELSQGKESASLRLESFVQSKSKLYPGQRTQFIYRIFYKKEIELTQQYLPLLEAQGFKRIGDPNVENFQEGSYQIQEVSQEVEVVKTGEFHFPLSLIEGFPYREDFFGRRSYEKPRLRSEAEAITVYVSAFPKEGQPASFTGALGEYSLSARLLNSPKVAVGDKLEVEIRVSGSGDLHTVKPPVLSQQKDLLDQFHLPDLPPFGKVSGISKTFTIEIRPLSVESKEIPPIVFSFFEPSTEKYRELHTDAIPIDVVLLEDIQVLAKEEILSAISEDTIIWEEETARELKPIIISSHIPKGMFHSFFPRYMKYVFWGLPLALFLIFFQIFLKRYLKYKQMDKICSHSDTLWALALSCQDQPAKCLSLIEKAFIKRLQEQKKLSQTCHSLGQVSGLESVQTLLNKMEASIYSPQGGDELKPLICQLEHLFQEVGS